MKKLILTILCLNLFYGCDNPNYNSLSKEPGEIKCKYEAGQLVSMKINNKKCQIFGLYNAEVCSYKLRCDLYAHYEFVYVKEFEIESYE